MLALGFPIIIAGLVLSFKPNSDPVIDSGDSFKSVHSVSMPGEYQGWKYKLTCVFQILGFVSIVWMLIQILLGGLSVWFGGRAFGGGAKAKTVWRYHR